MTCRSMSLALPNDSLMTSRLKSIKLSAGPSNLAASASFGFLAFFILYRIVADIVDARPRQ